ncbi:tripartite motif-containing protein 16-like [Pundamilia nyererei]|uniref:Tripartite motif-containing protein 16-like n=1 Tax=Pundamilia nyererei TaxID=303518 RepID=A0A9Y3VTG1_9CICH|nr:PREDICTED: tripartite motif-containing protein 16-like [Pundamilia nyererei]
MAHQLIQLDQEKLSCSICLDLLKDPVTIPCGHSYCMSCIKNCWDENETHSCPQCRQTFTPRPVLVKNTMFADLVEDLKKAGLPADSSGHAFAGPGDVACDFCSVRKRKASKSCLVCMASYCEQHLQPHYNVAPLKKHKLIDATSKLQENICPRHDEVMKIFCCTDQRCICYLCLMNEHKNHVTVSAAAERANKQKDLAGNRQQIKNRIQNRETDVNLLQREVEAISLSADKALMESEKMFKDLICLIKKKSSEVKQKIRSKKKTEQTRVKELQEKLEQEIRDLRQKDTEVEQLSLTEDHIHFLKNFSSVTHLNEYTNLPSTSNHTLQYFQGVIAAVLQAGNKLTNLLSDEWTKISLAVNKADVLLPQEEPTTREEFLKYSCGITLDQSTTETYLSLSDNNRKLHGNQSYGNYSENWHVCSKEVLTGPCYWEVKWTGAVTVGVTYMYNSCYGSKTERGLGTDLESWALKLSHGSYQLRHKNISTSLSGPQSFTVGVYLDHRAGILSFYSITETMNLLHRVQTRFTKPLYAGFWLPQDSQNSLELCELKETSVTES